MIVVCDINEIWRRKPFSAMADRVDVLGVSPADWITALKHGFESAEGALEVLPIWMPLGWASKTAGIGQQLLWRRIMKKCRVLGKSVDYLVVTSPHYLPMLDMVPGDLKTIYYASDDYRSYEGWQDVALREEQLVRRVDHAFFVSEGLRQRALDEYGVNGSRLSVSMNATEERFFLKDAAGPVPPPIEGLKRPIAGVVGGIGGRIDINLLRRCIELDALGTLLLVGPLPKVPSPEEKALLAHPKCVAVGPQPHAEIHTWYQCFDVGLIPYVPTELNRLCSPMRLFDHLASGAWIISTTACDQVKTFAEQVRVCSSTDSFLHAVEDCLGKARSRMPVKGITWNDRANEMLMILNSLPHA